MHCANIKFIYSYPHCPLLIISLIYLFAVFFSSPLHILNNSAWELIERRPKAGSEEEKEEEKKNWAYRRQFVSLTKLISQSRWLFIGTTLARAWGVRYTQKKAGWQTEFNTELFQLWLTFVWIGRSSYVTSNKLELFIRKAARGWREKRISQYHNLRIRAVELSMAAFLHPTEFLCICIELSAEIYHGEAANNVIKSSTGAAQKLK